MLAGGEGALVRDAWRGGGRKTGFRGGSGGMALFGGDEDDVVEHVDERERGGTGTRNGFIADSAGLRCDVAGERRKGLGREEIGCNDVRGGRAGIAGVEMASEEGRGGGGGAACFTWALLDTSHEALLRLVVLGTSAENAEGVDPAV